MGALVAGPNDFPPHCDPRGAPVTSWTIRWSTLSSHFSVALMVYRTFREKYLNATKCWGRMVNITVRHMSLHWREKNTTAFKDFFWLCTWPLEQKDFIHCILRI